MTTDEYISNLEVANADLLNALEAMFFQFEHNGDEADSDRAVLDQAQITIAKAKSASATSL